MRAGRSQVHDRSKRLQMLKANIDAAHRMSANIIRRSSDGPTAKRPNRWRAPAPESPTHGFRLLRARTTAGYQSGTSLLQDGPDPAELAKLQEAVDNALKSEASGSAAPCRALRCVAAQTAELRCCCRHSAGLHSTRELHGDLDWIARAQASPAHRSRPKSGPRSSRPCELR